MGRNSIHTYQAPPLISTVFPDDITVDPHQSHRITTYFNYTLFPGTLAVQSITTTWPVVSTAQNGSGMADSTTQYFDLYGNPTWSKDERGFLTRMAYQ
jgi:hypothetical protein